jgi:hypothetical protein
VAFALLHPSQGLAGVQRDSRHGFRNALVLRVPFNYGFESSGGKQGIVISVGGISDRMLPVEDLSAPTSSRHLLVHYSDPMEWPVFNFFVVVRKVFLDRIGNVQIWDFPFHDQVNFVEVEIASNISEPKYPIIFELAHGSEIRLSLAFIQSLRDKFAPSIRDSITPCGEWHCSWSLENLFSEVSSKELAGYSRSTTDYKKSLVPKLRDLAPDAGRSIVAVNECTISGGDQMTVSKCGDDNRPMLKVPANVLRKRNNRPAQKCQRTFEKAIAKEGRVMGSCDGKTIWVLGMVFTSVDGVHWVDSSGNKQCRF